MAAGTRSDRVKRLRLRAFRRATRRRPWRRMSRLSLRRFVDSRNTTVDAPAPALPVGHRGTERARLARLDRGGRRPTLVTERSGRAAPGRARRRRVRGQPCPSRTGSVLPSASWAHASRARCARGNFGVQAGCAVGRIRISLTSMCGGCCTANITARAMSSACSGSSFSGESKNGVSVMPGSITVTRTPLSLSSWRSDSPIPVIAHFVAEYSEPTTARRPATEPVSSMWPLLSLSASSVARMVRAAP